MSRRQTIWNRLLYGYLAVMLGMLGISSGAAWSCRDGSLCPPGCRMHQGGARSPTLSTGIVHSSACSRCKRADPRGIGLPGSLLSCGAGLCALRTGEPPLTTLRQIAQFSFDGDCTRSSELICLHELTDSEYIVTVQAVLPSVVVRPNSERAPPSLL